MRDNRNVHIKKENKRTASSELDFVLIFRVPLMHPVRSLWYFGHMQIELI